MNKKILTMAFMLLGAMGGMQAQVKLVNPIPQQVKTSEVGLFNVPAKWSLKADKERLSGYIYDALRTAAPEVAEKQSFEITIGVRGDKSVRKYRKLIPAKKEGYYLQIDQKGIVIAGNDEHGLYYGVQTLLGIMQKGKLEACTITDWPDVPFRGTVEGFYGTPWSHQARISQLEFYGRNKMNVYIYGPKDDPWHRDKWRVAYPEAEAKRIHELVEVAKKNGVNFYWAIHPGVDIKWTTEDRDALVAKFEKMYDLGVRSFAVFFDDIWGEGTKADKQAELLNYVDNNFIQKKHDVSPLVMCPTEYNRAWANDQKGYLRTLGTKMNKGIEIMWTGNSVIHCIDKESMEWINQRIDRKAYIWWNFPVSDYVRDHILLGPAYGNGLDIANDVSGFVSNPMEHAEASKISLYGIADYTWNMKAYDYKADWEKGLKAVLPSNYEALRTFALYNKDLGPNGHGFRREEGDEMKELAAKAIAGDHLAWNGMLRKCAALKCASDVLFNDESNPALIKELLPWLFQAKLVASYGEAVCLLSFRAKGNQIESEYPKFKDLYNQARSLQKQMYDIENSPIRHPLQPGIKVGTRVMLPTLNKMFTNAVNVYNSKKGTKLNAVAEYNPYKLTSTVKQLAMLPVTVRGNDIKISPALEVINWQEGGELVLESDRAITFQGMDFNLGVAGAAKHFRLELFVNGAWKQVSLLHYSDKDPVIHTGNELGGMSATKMRLTNISGAEQKVYFKHFKIVKR